MASSGFKPSVSVWSGHVTELAASLRIFCLRKVYSRKRTGDGRKADACEGRTGATAAGFDFRQIGRVALALILSKVNQ